MRHISAEPVTSAAFEPFGRVIDMTGADDTGLQLTQGPNWVDRYTLRPLAAATPSLGRTIGSDIGSPVVSMERHSNVEEIILPAADPVVLTVAAANDEAFAAASDVKSFLIAPGTAVVMHPGTWHAACAGLDGPTPTTGLPAAKSRGHHPGPTSKEDRSWSHSRPQTSGARNVRPPRTRPCGVHRRRGGRRVLRRGHLAPPRRQS